MDRLQELRDFTEYYSTAPTLETMPRRNLADKGIEGPTGAHVIEEIHTPFNLAYITVTTGTTAFQNITGITHSELPERIKAAVKALKLAGVTQSEKILFTYPPLVNVFPKQALEEYGLTWTFLKTSSRDALILALCEGQYKAVIGESSFLRAALEDAGKMGLSDLLPRDLILITAGTPLDLELIETANRMVNGTVHDLYGCQEFGWLTLDGIPLRDDITLIPAGDDGYHDLIVGGLPTGDRFPVADKGHICNGEGKIITYSRIRTEPDYEVTVLKTTVKGRETIERLAKTILRIKAKIVRISPEIQLEGDRTILSLSHYGAESGNGGAAEGFLIEGSVKTMMFDSLLQAQLDYQSQSKTDPTWIKGR